MMGKLRRAGAAVRERTNPARLVTSRLRALPAFVIIGGQKCGTTSLYRYLSLHPQVLPARLKEIHFFDRNFARGLGWYRAQFPVRATAPRRGAAPGWITGEATPYYLFHPAAAERLAATLPEVTLIALLRNPVDRAYSHYQHVRARGHEPLSFEEAIEQEPKRLAGEAELLRADPRYRSLPHERYSYCARGRYAEQLAGWMARFSPAQLLILRAEDMFADASATVLQVHRFLGLQPVEHGTLGHFLRGGYREAMAPATREDLVDYFRPHNAELESMVQQRFDWDR